MKISYIHVKSTLAGLGISEIDMRENISTFKIKSDIPEEKLRDLVDHAQKRLPVLHIVSHLILVEVSMKKEETIYFKTDYRSSVDLTSTFSLLEAKEPHCCSPLHTYFDLTICPH
jgi:hypothetical protein